MTDGSAQATDPFEPMRRSYEEALEAWSKTVEQMVGTEQFAGASRQLLTQYTEMQKAIRDTSRATADALHVPSKDDLARVAELVVNVERKLDESSAEAHRVADLVERMPVEGLAALPGRLLALETRLDALVAATESDSGVSDAIAAVVRRLEALEGKLDAVAQRQATAAGGGDVAPVLERLAALDAKIDGLASKPRSRAKGADAREVAEEARTGEAESLPAPRRATRKRSEGKG